jgi:hypothetical protein
MKQSCLEKFDEDEVQEIVLQVELNKLQGSDWFYGHTICTMQT